MLAWLLFPLARSRSESVHWTSDRLKWHRKFHTFNHLQSDSIDFTSIEWFKAINDGISPESIETFEVACLLGKEQRYNKKRHEEFKTLESIAEIDMPLLSWRRKHTHTTALIAGDYHRAASFDATFGQTHRQGWNHLDNFKKINRNNEIVN